MNVTATVVERALKQITVASPDPKVQAFIQTNSTLSEAELIKRDISQAITTAMAELPKEWQALRGKYSAAQISQVDVDVVAGVLKAISQGCSGSPGEAARAALVADVMEFSFPDLFKVLEPHCSVSSNVRTWSSQIVHGFQVKMDLRPDGPVYERDAFERHQEAVERQSFSGMSEFLGMLNRGVGLPRHSIIEKITCLAAKADIPTFANWLDERVRIDFLATHMALCALSVDILVKVATVAQSYIVKMDALTLLVDNRSYYKDSFTPSGVSAVIQTLLTDSTGWRTFCEFFGEYPTRTPTIWHPTGVALHGAPSDCIQTLIDSFNTGRYNPHPDEYSQILIGLTAEPSPQSALISFLSATDAKWGDYFRRRRHSLKDPATDIELTNYYGAMLNAIIMRWNLPRLKRHIRRQIQCLGLIHSRWFESETAITSYVVLSASQLLPYIEAYSHMAVYARDVAFESEAANAIDYYIGYFYGGLWRGAETYAAETIKML